MAMYLNKNERFAARMSASMKKSKASDNQEDQSKYFTDDAKIDLLKPPTPQNNINESEENTST